MKLSINIVSLALPTLLLLNLLPLAKSDSVEQTKVKSDSVESTEVISLDDDDDNNTLRGRRLKGKKGKGGGSSGGGGKKKGGSGGGNRGNRGNGGGGGGGGGGFVEELYPCIPFEASSVQDKAKLENTEDTCLSNSCSGGCCRDYNWLICDEQNGMPFMRCVCNENTVTAQTTTDDSAGKPEVINLPPFISASLRPQETPTPPVTTPATQPPVVGSPTMPRVTPAPTHPMLAPTPTIAPAAPPTMPPTPPLTDPPTDPQPTDPPSSSPTQPLTPAPTKAPTKQPTVPLGFGGNPNVCLEGSIFHQFDVESPKCFSSSDCAGTMDDCCLVGFCLCGPSRSANGSDCVPAQT